MKLGGIDAESTPSHFPTTPPHPGVFGYLMQWRSHPMGVPNLGTPIKWERPFTVKCGVQFATGGRQIAPTFPLIDARFFGTPIKWERPLNGNAHSSGMPNPSERPFIGNAQSIVKRGRCNFSAGGREIAQTFPFIGTPIRWERHCIRWERPIDSRECPIVL